MDADTPMEIPPRPDTSAHKPMVTYIHGGGSSGSGDLLLFFLAMLISLALFAACMARNREPETTPTEDSFVEWSDDEYRYMTYGVSESNK